MDKKKRVLAILIGLCGLICIGGYFFLVLESPIIEFIKSDKVVPSKEINEKAQFFTKALKIDLSRFTQKISTEIDYPLLQYLQYYKRKFNEFPNLTAGFWHVTWKEKGTFFESIFSMNKVELPELIFDFQGRLTGFRINPKYRIPVEPTPMTEEKALRVAKIFLETIRINTKALELEQKKIDKSKNQDTYHFIFRSKISPYPSLTNTFTMEIIEKQIVSYYFNQIPDPEVRSPRDLGSEPNIAFIIQGLAIFFIAILIIMIFIKKLRQDVIEFKKALLAAVFVAILTVINHVSGNYYFQAEQTISGILSGILVLFVIMILFSTTEAYIRSIYPEKLEIIDLFFQKKGAVHETGFSILKSIFLSGITLLLMGLIVFFSTTLDLGNVEWKEFMISPLDNLSRSMYILSSTIISTVFSVLGILGFWAGYLEDKFKKSKLLKIVFLAFIFDITVLHMYLFEPGFDGILVMLPIAVGWAIIVRKWELFSIFLSMLWVNLLLNLMLIFIMPESIWSFQVIGISLFFILLFIVGTYLLYRRQSVKDYSTYVPEYINRIAEKERFLKELEIARGIQMQLLPQSAPHFASFEISSFCQPAMEVGGDYYDFIHYDERYMSVLIGDVSGKGVSAAFYMTMAKGIIKTLSRVTKEPGKLLEEANDIFYENTPRNVFITMILGIFDMTEKKLIVARAGHNPLIVRRCKTGETETITSRGIALGLCSREKYRESIEEISVPFESNDVFVFYTDGVTDAMNHHDECFGEERLKSIIKNFGQYSPQKLQEKIYQAVNDFKGKVLQHDDFTMVIIKIP